MSAAETVRAIDWASIRPGNPIPASMPRGSSDDPLEAGFAPQWAEHALKDMNVGFLFRPSERKGGYTLAEPLALVIMSRKRAPEDRWAHEVEQKLWEIVHSQAERTKPLISRVFCNSMGCLFYLEREGETGASGFLYFAKAETNGDWWGKQFGIDLQKDIYLNTIGTRDPAGKDVIWQLVFIIRRGGPLKLGPW